MKIAIEEAFLYWIFSTLAELAICVSLIVFEITLDKLCPLVMSAVVGTVVSFLRGHAQGCCWSPKRSCEDLLCGQDGGSVTASLLNLVSSVDKNSFLNAPMALRMRFFSSFSHQRQWMYMYVYIYMYVHIYSEERSQAKTNFTDQSQNKGALLVTPKMSGVI